jgi:hypothetical protein
MRTTRTVASCLALGLALLTNIGSSGLDWTEQAYDGLGPLVVERNTTRSFTVWVAANEDALEGSISLSLEADTESVGGQPVLVGSLGWEGEVYDDGWADSWHADALNLSADPFGGFMGNCWEEEEYEPPATWEEGFCWVPLEVAYEAVDGDVQLTLDAFAVVEGHGTQGNLIPDPQLVVVIEE